jgi:hypothetical protein
MCKRKREHFPAAFSSLRLSSCFLILFITTSSVKPVSAHLHQNSPPHLGILESHGPLPSSPDSELRLLWQNLMEIKKESLSKGKAAGKMLPCPPECSAPGYPGHLGILNGICITDDIWKYILNCNQLV